MSILKNERDELIIKNIGLVKDRVIFLNNGIYNDDLFQEGTIGLIKAVDNFDKSCGVKLSTYAKHCIDGQIMEYKRYNSIIKPYRKNGKYHYMCIVSTDELIKETDLRHGDMLCGCNNLEDETINKIYLEHIIGELNERDRKIMIMWLDGDTQKNICKASGANRSKIPIIVKRTKMKYLNGLDDNIKY